MRAVDPNIDHSSPSIRGGDSLDGTVLRIEMEPPTPFMYPTVRGTINFPGGGLLIMFETPRTPPSFLQHVSCGWVGGWVGGLGWGRRSRAEKPGDAREPTDSAGAVADVCLQAAADHATLQGAGSSVRGVPAVAHQQGRKDSCVLSSADSCVFSCGGSRERDIPVARVRLSGRSKQTPALLPAGSRQLQP